MPPPTHTLNLGHRVSAPESVCCGNAVPAVAEQSNTREAESVAFVALTLPSTLPFLLPRVLSLSLAQLCAGPYGELPADTVCFSSFQICRIQASGFQVMLADVFVPECWSACWSGAGGELTIHDVLRNPAILHSADMAEPA